MKPTANSILATVLVVLFVSSVHAQSPAEPRPTDPDTRPRSVVLSPPQKQPPVVTPAPAQPAIPVNPQRVDATQRLHAAEEKAEGQRQLSPTRIHAKLSEAKRLLRSRPSLTAMSSPTLDYVTLAALQGETGQIHLITLSKQSFLARGTELGLTSSLGTPLQLRIIRANGVNTAVTLFDNQGRSLVPLLVEFPIERRGVFRELAYYTSAHPALLSADVVKAGQTYVNTMVDLAAKRLRDKGTNVAPHLVAIAKRLCIVEHTDHDRFRQENRIALFEEIYSLYALNELDTYRYSVSSAGAGGMVQMIPWAYQSVRQRHPGAGLNPDFVSGMRNHGNALEAMLLYMHDTWNDLTANDEVKYALNAKLASEWELMAAGYNSNAAKLPGYLQRGGTAWRTLIPRETQMYLQIYRSFDSLVPAKSH
ncbi:MAG: hypothetical protein ABI596_14440 [Pyrinomonadaceae bacterium]